MKLLLLVVLSGLAVVQTARAIEIAQAPGRVSVVFVCPEKFTDSTDDAMASDASRQLVLDELKAHFELLAKRYIPAGQRLELTINDVDLAGSYEPWRGMDFDHVRIMRDIYPPSINLSFRLLATDGKVLAEGTRQLRDFGYLQIYSMPSSDPLCYDKGMISSWMRMEFKRS